MANILAMDRDQLAALDPAEVTRLLTPEEVEHMAKELGALWLYDYVALEAGKAGMHALLKSLLHSDGFFVSRILLAFENIRQIMARQIIMRLNEARVPTPDYLAGVPDGATLLGEATAQMMGVNLAEMTKVDGKITFTTALKGAHPTLLLLEDFCTRGTGFREAVLAVKQHAPHIQIFRYNPVIINRGGLDTIAVDGWGTFKVLPVVSRRINDWPAESCPLCQKGSTVIKPKATDENWQLINASQL